MLSYQHSFHAGNLADLHKHGLLAWTLNYLIQKDKPLSYIETHSGRGLYDLRSADALKTGEAAQGIGRHADWFGAEHPFTKARQAIRATHGDTAYPGSPAIAAHLLRPSDALHLAELHLGEFDALRKAFRGRAKCYRQDGFELAKSLCPPTPRRGLLLIDPPYEIKDDYDTIPGHIATLTRAWNVGVIMLWYPILTSNAHRTMLDRLTKAHPDGLRHEVRFPPARHGHGMVGSGLFIVNAPYGLDAEAEGLNQHYAALS